MGKDILGVYQSKGTGRTSAVAHTPDATKYHDASQVHLEGESAGGASVLSRLPGNHGFRALRGVIIPRSTPLGASRGHDHNSPAVIHIDPGPYDEGIVVNLSLVDKESMARAVNDAAGQANDVEELAVAAFTAVSTRPPARTARRAPPEEEERLPPLQMPGTYVVPKASPGGGQVKRARFTDRELRDRDEAERQRRRDASAPESPVRSLHDALDEDVRQPGTPPPAGPAADAPPRQVTFEIPGGHQFRVLYHDVVRHGITLVLVYDHDRPFQMVYFPPPLEDESGEPVGMAVLVHARPRSGEKSVLYRVTSPGIQFKYRNTEFCLLLIDKEKDLDSEKE